MTRLLFSFITLLLFSDFMYAQNYQALQYRELGPYRGGRVTTVAGVASQPSVFYLGATGGGVWKTEDYGTTWHNISDGFFTTPSIGAIAVAQNDPNIIYVGTGSDGLRSNVIAGKGIYKSIDGGENWTHIGLEKTGQIGAIRIDPSNHNVVYVAAIGNAFKSNPERGVFKTINGGKTWDKVLYLSDNVGFSDIEFMPSNPNILYASAWKAERKPWTIISGGTADEGGLYKSIDAGATWDKVEAGLPSKLIGKIDAAVCPSDSRIVYALVEAPEKKGGLYKSVDQGESFEQVSSHKGIRSRPFYYTNIRVDPTNSDIIYGLATGYYKSTDGGKKWSRMRPPHGDNHDMWINPDNPELFIQANDGGANVTFNGGKTWSTQFNQPTAEIYQIEVDNQYPYWVYGGQQDNYSTIAVPTQAPYGIQAPGIGYIINTGGCETGPAVPKPDNHNIVYANCKGRFGVFDKTTGIEKSYYVGASNMYGHNPKDLKYRFQRVSPIHVSPHDPDVVYHCSQYVHKTTDDGVTWETISPDLTAFEEDKQMISGSPITRDITGEEYYSTIYAIRESPIEQGLIWVGANDGPIHVTHDGGANWSDVTPRGIAAGGRVDAVEPSPHNAAKAYACILRYQLGDERPYIYRTDNYGRSWTLLTTGSNGIPDDHPVRVIREDPTTEGVLYAGTEYGMYLSTNDGEMWTSFQQNLPVTPITDLKVHRGDIALSTMGRGFWVLENASVVGQMDSDDETVLYKPRETVRYRSPSGRGSSTPAYPRPSAIIDYYLADTIDELQIEIIDQDGHIVTTLRSDTITIKEEINEDMSLNEVEYIVDNSLSTDLGLNRYHWDMRQTGPWHKTTSRKYKNGPLAQPGNYTVRMTAGDQLYEQTFELVMDPRTTTHVDPEDIAKQIALHRDVMDLLSAARQLEDDLNKEKMNLQKKKDDNNKNRLAEIERQLGILKTDEGIYMLPKLVDQISYLNSMLGKADQKVGKDAYERYEELTMQLEKLLNR